MSAPPGEAGFRPTEKDVGRRYYCPTHSPHVFHRSAFRRLSFFPCADIAALVHVRPESRFGPVLGKPLQHSDGGRRAEPPPRRTSLRLSRLPHLVFGLQSSPAER